MNNNTYIDCTGFDWNYSNQDKNQQKHHVSQVECEQVFFNSPLLVHEDIKHSKIETRYYLLGRTSADRQLFIAFNIRNRLMRNFSNPYSAAKKPITQIPMHAPKMAFKKICKASSKQIKHKSTK